MSTHKLIELPKGFLKSLNDFNQDVKSIYDKYIIYPDGTVVSDNSCKYKIGEHFCKTNFSMRKIDEFFNSFVIEFDSDSIYRAIKDNKKYIKYIRIDEDVSVHLTGQSLTELGTPIDLDILVGQCYLMDSYKVNKCDKLYSSANICISEKVPNTIIISDEDVEQLVKNQYKNYSLDRYSTRITREVIPGLKKSHELSLSFYDNDNDDRLFNIRLIARRGTLISYHMYTCIYM